MTSALKHPLARGVQALAFLWIVAGLLAGCATQRAAREIAGAEDRIRKVHIDGNRAVDDKTVREHLYMRPTTWFPLPKRRYFFEGYLPIDMDRIEELYATRGYHEARVVDAKVERVKERKVVDLRFVVEEGPSTDLVSIDFRWPEGEPAEGLDRRDVEKRNLVALEKPFDVAKMHESEALMKAAIMAKGFPFAQVEGHARVNRSTRQATLEYTFEPGPRLKIGKIRLEGLQQIPEKPVRTELEGYEGKWYAPHRIRAIEQAVYGLGVFSSVAAVLDEQPRDEFVDLTLYVSEGKPQQIKLGFGLAFEPARWEQFVSAIYSHRNLFKSLTHLDVQVRAGYAELPRLIDIENYRPVSGVREHGPIFEVKPRLRKKGLLERHLVWEWAPAFELGIQHGYQYYSPSNRVGVSRFFTRFVETSISHNVRFFDYFNRDPSIDTQQSILGLDFRDPYLLSYVEFGLWFHITDRVLNPTQGVVIGAVYDLAGGIFGGDYDYNKIMPEIRGYWTPLRNRLQLAARIQTGFILPFGDEPGAPFAFKFYLGGASTVRGWGLRRLSPYLNNCDTQPPGCVPIPIGGNSMIMGNFETRVRVWRDLWVIGFFDMGDVQADVADVRPSQWNYAAGPGLRYKSPVGTFRLDLGFRINETDRFESQARWALHFGLGETF